MAQLVAQVGRQPANEGYACSRVQEYGRAGAHLYEDLQLHVLVGYDLAIAKTNPTTRQGGGICDKYLPVGGISSLLSERGYYMQSLNSLMAD